MCLWSQKKKSIGLLLLAVRLFLLLPQQVTATALEESQNEKTVLPKPDKNPFAKGCLHARSVPGAKMRVCNSDDPPDASRWGHCRLPSYPQDEIRLLNAGWESVVFENWILQILLSELNDVPTSIELGDFSDSKVNFYDPGAGFSLDGPDVYEALGNAYNRTCSWSSNGNKKSESVAFYQPCAHFVPESWGARKAKARSLVQEGVLEQPQALGVLGQEGWFMPLFTAQRDPSLLSYLGLQGESNRRKLAERFLRPTTWEDYCEQVSPDGCRTPDSVAQRAPLAAPDDNDDEHGEYDRMFVEGLYTGHFRATEENDCDLHPTNCTGFFADYPCGWRSKFVCDGCIECLPRASVAFSYRLFCRFCRQPPLDHRSITSVLLWTAWCQEERNTRTRS